MKIAILVDHLEVSVWQARAIEGIRGCTELIIYNCTNSRAGRKSFRHGAYYALNLMTIRNRLTKRVPVSSLSLQPSKVVDFATEYEGAWQRIPHATIREIESDHPDVILKFGLGLLRVPERDLLSAPILSYHHGDPSAYRGRPAGFYELLEGRPLMGQMVQRLSNRLDAGEVVAFAETKVFPHSYRETLLAAYGASPLLLGTAIQNARSGRDIARPPTGKVYRLPGNLRVVRFVVRMAAAFVRRLAYGALFEKRWEVSVAPCAPEALLSGGDLPPPAEWRKLERPASYNFLADPFFEPGGEGFLVEALHATSGKGEILRITNEEARRLSDPAVHHSYPASVSEGSKDYVVPEACESGRAIIYSYEDCRMEAVGELDVAGAGGLLDPTFLRHEGSLYLFANRKAEGAGILRLWRSSSLFARFEEHPASPIRISPEGSRMAGEIFSCDGRLLRLGQQWGKSYGSGLLIFGIDALSPESYSESLLRSIAFGDGIKGPHTLNFRNGLALFDWYRDAFTPAAGLRRLAARRGRSATSA